MSVGSPSLHRPDYWWFRARAQLLHSFFGPHLSAGDLMLDVGSADGPSLGWVSPDVRRVAMDRDPRGLAAGAVCADLVHLPFGSGVFDVVGAFDVLEHVDVEARALAEVVRVLRPGGRLLLSVPAYAWAWTSHDKHNAHYRRYTRRSLRTTLGAAGLEVVRTSHAFAAVFPFFAAQRLASRAGHAVRRRGPAAPQDVVSVPRVPEPVKRALVLLCRLDGVLLPRVDLPVGSSVFALAVKPRA